LSEKCGSEYEIRWNKSFDLDSIVYSTGKAKVVRAVEQLPNTSEKMGRLEALVAPYQSEPGNDLPDVLFFWEEI